MFYTLVRRGLALMATMFLPHDLPLLTSLAQLLLDAVYLVLVWRWRPYLRHEVVVPFRLNRLLCGLCCRRNQFKVKPGENLSAYEMEDRLVAMGLSDDQARQLAVGADLDGDGTYDEDEIRALMLAAKKMSGGSSKFGDDGDGKLHIQGPSTFSL